MIVGGSAEGSDQRWCDLGVMSCGMARHIVLHLRTIQTSIGIVNKLQIELLIQSAYNVETLLNDTHMATYIYIYIVFVNMLMTQP